MRPQEAEERKAGVGADPAARAARRTATARPRSAGLAAGDPGSPGARGPFLLSGSSGDGIVVEGTDAVLVRGGREVERASLGPLARRTAPADPTLTALFPERTFCYSEPFVAREATANIGPSELLDDLEKRGLLGRLDLYEPSLLESFDGEIRLALDGGRRFSASFREWRKNAANLEHFPVHHRRVVDLSLPDALGAPRRRDTVLLSRLARLVSDLLEAYVGSEGATASVVHEGPLTNLFKGGEAPPPLFAPVLFGRRLNDVYDEIPRAPEGDPAPRHG